MYALMQQAWEQGLTITCPRCSEPITADQTWDVGHRVDIIEDATAIWNVQGLRPEHASCNRSAGAVVTNQRRRQQRQRTRRWL